MQDIRLIANSIYHSGPGWFNDILELDIVLDSEIEVASEIPRFSRVNPVPPERRVAKQPRQPDPDADSDEELDEPMTEEDYARRSDGRYNIYFHSLVPSGVPVTGFLRAKAPIERVVYHTGISALLESSLYVMDDLATRTLHYEEIDICGPGQITAGVDLPFAFLNTANEPLVESYEGKLFSIRHKITVVVKRPWYTFDVVCDTPFAVQSAYSLPREVENIVPALKATLQKSSAIPAISGASKPVAGSEDASTAVDSSSEPCFPELPLSLYKSVASFQPQVLPLEGLPKGSVSVHLERTAYEMNEQLSATIVCDGVESPILLLKLAIVRIEYADGEAADTLLLDESVMDARRWRQRRLAELDYSQMVSRLKDSANAAKAAILSGTPMESTSAEGKSKADDSLEVSVEASASSTAADGSVESGSSKDASAESVDAAPLTEAERMRRAVENFEADPEEYDVEDPDPDLPIIGDIKLAIEVDISLLGVQPTIVVDASDVGTNSRTFKKEKAAAPRSGNPLSSPTASGTASGSSQKGVKAAAVAGDSSVDEEDKDKVTVRYFLRLTAYTSLSSEGKVWNATELIFFRNKLQCTPVPRFRLPSVLTREFENELKGRKDEAQKIMEAKEILGKKLRDSELSTAHGVDPGFITEVSIGEHSHESAPIHHNPLVSSSSHGGSSSITTNQSVHSASVNVHGSSAGSVAGSAFSPSSVHSAPPMFGVKPVIAPSPRLTSSAQSAIPASPHSLPGTPSGPGTPQSSFSLPNPSPSLSSIPSPQIPLTIPGNVVNPSLSSGPSPGGVRLQRLAPQNIPSALPSPNTGAFRTQQFKPAGSVDDHTAEP